jgi:sec-independent protein translocase protein TatA
MPAFDSVGLAASRGQRRFFMLEGLFQPTHLLVIFFVALLVFGPKKLPELGKGIGEGIRALKNGMKDGATEEAKVPGTPVETKATDFSNRSK